VCSCDGTSGTSSRRRAAGRATAAAPSVPRLRAPADPGRTEKRGAPTTGQGPQVCDESSETIYVPTRPPILRYLGPVPQVRCFSRVRLDKAEKSCDLRRAQKAWRQSVDACCLSAREKARSAGCRVVGVLRSASPRLPSSRRATYATVGIMKGRGSRNPASCNAATSSSLRAPRPARRRSSTRALRRRPRLPIASC
jgi:hypothetical protein